MKSDANNESIRATPTFPAGSAFRTLCVMHAPPPTIVVDDALPADALAALRDGVLGSHLLGDSPLGGTFSATRGFSVTFHRSRAADVIARFPFVSPFLDLALDHARVRGVQRKPLLGGPPVPNAFYMNVLVVPPGASVGKHVDATLGPSNGSVIPEAVAVLYLDVPEDLRGGALALFADDALVEEIEPVPNRFVLFAGRLGHEVRAVSASRPRLSIVCEQYALSPGVLSAVPPLKVQSRNAFQRVLADVRSRK